MGYRIAPCARIGVLPMGRFYPPVLLKLVLGLWADGTWWPNMTEPLGNLLTCPRSNELVPSFFLDCVRLGLANCLENEGNKEGASGVVGGTNMYWEHRKGWHVRMWMEQHGGCL